MAAEMARQGRRDAPIDILRAAVQSEMDVATYFSWDIQSLCWSNCWWADALGMTWVKHAYRRTVEARLRPVPVPFLQLWPLHCRVMLANAVSDAESDAETVNRYHSLAEELDARGHLAAAKRFLAE